MPNSFGLKSESCKYSLSLLKINFFELNLELKVVLKEI